MPARRDTQLEHRDGRAFVRDEDSGYGLFSNSVHRVADWLRMLEAEVSGGAVTANFRLPEHASDLCTHG